MVCWTTEQCCPQALRVLETSDLQSLRDARQQRLKDQLKAHPDSAEGAPFQPADLNAMLALAQKGMSEIFELQTAALAD